MFVFLQFPDDIVGNGVFSQGEIAIGLDVLDGEIEEIRAVVDRDGYDGGMGVAEDGGDTDVERLGALVVVGRVVSATPMEGWLTVRAGAKGPSRMASSLARRARWEEVTAWNFWPFLNAIRA